MNEYGDGMYSQIVDAKTKGKKQNDALLKYLQNHWSLFHV